MNAESESSIKKQHLDWTAKQGRIVTCNGKANSFYTAEEGYPFLPTELPHYHLLNHDNSNNATHEIFDQWRKQDRSKAMRLSTSICGAWKRTLFVGGTEHSTDRDEIVWNLQSSTLFVDLRIPASKSIVLSRLFDDDVDKSREISSLQQLTNEELALFARQHVFAGYTKCKERRDTESTAVDRDRPYPLLCTRHHCIDWNFIGIPRPRPNKWYVEPSCSSPYFKHFKEWSYATDYYRQSYYFETWERALTSNATNVVALRKASCDEHEQDGVIVAIGDHFNYIHGRRCELSRGPPDAYSSATNLVELVDMALKNNDRETAIDCLSIDAGHGRISTDSKTGKVKWTIDCAIQPWKQGICLFEDDITVTGGPSLDLDNCYILWTNEKWKVFECPFQNVNELAMFLGCSPYSGSKL